MVDRQIEQMDAICRAAQARTRAPRRPTLCFDEWNVWYRMFDTDGGWTHAPHMLEELYNLEDALVVAGFLNSFVRHADVVRIANLAQVANVIAPVLTRGDELLVQSIFHPFAMFSQRRAGTSLRVATSSASDTRIGNAAATSATTRVRSGIRRASSSAISDPML